MVGNKKIEVAEIIDLIEKIKDGATSSKAPLSEVLRLCLRLGKQLGNDQLSSWASAELNGYKSEKELPDYRKQIAQVRGHFSGPFGSGIRNAQIPQFSINDDEHRKRLFTSYFFDPVAELEQLTSGDKSETLQSFWPADIVAYYQLKEIYQGMVLSTAWRELSKSSLAGVLDTIRTRVLEFVLSIEDELNIKSQGNKKEVEVNQLTSDKVSQIVHNVIYGGNVSIGNIGDTVQQIITIQPGDLASLKKYLKELGLTDNLLEELDQALEKDIESPKQPGAATSSWLSRVMIMIGRGSISVTSNAAGSLIATALMQYLGNRF
jgi:AbiTii